MAFCTNCGQSVKDTANFCNYCGQLLRNAPLATRTPPTESPLPAIPTWPNDGQAQTDTESPGNLGVGEPPQLPNSPSPVLNQAPTFREPFSPKPDTPATTPSSPRGKLLLFALLFTAAGLALIFLVAPELTDKWTWLWNTWEETTPEYWMAMVGGGVCLLLAGIFLLKAITTEAR